MKVRPIIFVGNGRCYHTLDWYRSAQRVCAPRSLYFATDLLESEGHPRLLRVDDAVLPLHNIDRLLLPTQSRVGNIWRNAIKFAALPLQVRRLRALYANYPDATYHAHTMYYMLACALAEVPFVATPQGSEILVRPARSGVYRRFAVRALRAARAVTVDSDAMARGVAALAGRPAHVVQNGIDVEALLRPVPASERRTGILSIRAMDPNYRLHELLHARAAEAPTVPLTFCYPFFESGYRDGALPLMQSFDRDLGRLPRERMYEAMREALLVVSIPRSDSSPRSVYEAVFAGAPVAVSDNAYIEALPSCMRSRLCVVDPHRRGWLTDAMAWAAEVAATPFVPSDAALALFDQRRSMQRIADTFYD